jgi:hypothetical protein
MQEFITKQDTFAKPQASLLTFQVGVQAPQISKHLFTARLPFTQRDYAELQFFRQQIEQTREGLHPQPYTENKSSAMFYRLIFFGFALLFTLLGTCVVLATASMNFALLDFSIVIKGFLTLVCGILAASSLVLAIRMSAEREAIMNYYHKARSHASKIYVRKKMKLGIKNFLPFFGKNQRQAAALAHIYHDAWDKIHDCKEEALRLVNRISRSRELAAEAKERLYNQAIAEFNDKLMLIAHTFKASTLPHFGN